MDLFLFVQHCFDADPGMLQGTVSIGIICAATKHLTTPTMVFKILEQYHVASGVCCLYLVFASTGFIKQAYLRFRSISVIDTNPGPELLPCPTYHSHHFPCSNTPTSTQEAL